MASFQSANEMSLPKALVYNLKQSSLLVVSSNASCTGPGCSPLSCNQLNSDQEAMLIYDTLVATNFVQKTMLMQSSSNDCIRKGLLDTVEQQVSLASGDNGLFVLVYCGGICDSWDHGMGLSERESVSNFGDGFIDISPDMSVKRYSLVLNDYQATKLETHISGNFVGEVIRKVKPKQVKIILLCPHADKVAIDMQESLSDCELTVLASQMPKKVPCYLHTLECSTFTYFFTSLVSKTQFISGMFPLRSIFTQVQRCCEALSNLDLVQEGEWLKKNTSIPKTRFMSISNRADEEMERMNGNQGFSDDTVDGRFKCQVFISKYYKRGFLSRVQLCDEAKDWVQAVTEVCLFSLRDEEVLEGKVLQSAIGSMIFNIATIQNAKGIGSIANTNLFIKAFILVVAAVDITDPNIDLESGSLLTCASTYYLRAVCDNCTSNESKEMIKLNKVIREDNPAST